MRRTLIRIAGIALLAAGVAGLVFSIVGLVVLARVQHDVESAAMEQLSVVDRALAATADGLEVAKTTLSQAAGAAGSVETMMRTTGQAIGDTVPMVDSTAKLLGEQLPATLRTTQDTLTSVATTAKVIDDILGVVTAIPLLGLDRYSPETSLSQGLGDVAASLDEVPTTLAAAEEGLLAAGGNLGQLQTDFVAIADDIGGITGSLKDSEAVLAQYTGVVADLQDLVSMLQEGLPRWLGWLRLGFSLALIWLGIAQIGLLTQGWELVGRSRTPGQDQDKQG